MIILKTHDEIEIMRKANGLVARVLKELLPQYIKPGVTTFELDAIAEDFVLSNNAKPGFKGYRVGNRTFPSTLCVSINEEVVHGIPSKIRKLKEGDIVSIDIGIIVQGYYGDAAWTFPVGNIDEEAKKLLEVTEKSLYAGIEEAKAGNRILDIAAAIQSCGESAGFSIVRDYCGHGVGRMLHEDPQIPNYGQKGKGPKLEDGMVLAIEPMVNVGTYKVRTLNDGWTVITEDRKKSAHFEHSIAIINGRPEILSRI